MTISAPPPIPPQPGDASTKKRASTKTRPGLPLHLKLKRNDGGGMKHAVVDDDDDHHKDSESDVDGQVLDTRYITSSSW